MVITKQQINVHNTNYNKKKTQTRGAASATGTATLMVYQQQGSITYWLKYNIPTSSSSSDHLHTGSRLVQSHGAYVTSYLTGGKTSQTELFKSVLYRNTKSLFQRKKFSAIFKK